MLCESKQDGGLGFSDHHHPIRRNVSPRDQFVWPSSKREACYKLPANALGKQGTVNPKVLHATMAETSRHLSSGGVTKSLEALVASRWDVVQQTVHLPPTCLPSWVARRLPAGCGSAKNPSITLLRVVLRCAGGAAPTRSPPVNAQ